MRDKCLEGKTVLAIKEEWLQNKLLLLDVNVKRIVGLPKLILVAKSKTPSQTACSMTRLKAEVRVCSGASPRSQLIN